MSFEKAYLKDDFLNDVSITSDIRAKGEYKYFYIGENSSETDKSFLYFSTMWYTEKITKDMEIICSCYNHINTGQLFYNKQTKLYNIYIYKNKIDNKNENISLKLYRIINIAPLKRNINQSNNPKNQHEKDYQSIMSSKIFLASNDYILLNEIDARVLLININTGKYITIFRKNIEDNDLLYNIFDTYDELILKNGEHNIRTYIFVTLKKKDRKNPIYTYSYFIIQNTIEKNIHLHPINLDLGNSEPIGIKIAKIIHKDKKDNEQKCFYILCFLSTTVCLQFITNYDNLTLHQMFQKYCKIGKADEKGNKYTKKIRKKFWINKSFIKVEKVQLSQGINCFLNVNNKKLCALIYYFEMKGIVSYNFNYTDDPETISKKIFLVQKELNLNTGVEAIKRNDMKAKIYLFRDFYQFKNKCSFGYSDKNLLIFEKNLINIYEQNSEYPIFTYEFFDETLSSLVTFDNIGYTYILTEKKLFKIIYNDRYKFFDNDILFTKNKIHYYKYNYYKKGISQENLSYPLFELKPEDVWNAYCNNLNIKPIKFTDDNFWDDSLEKEEEEEFVIKIKNKNINYEFEKYENICALCNLESEMVCSHCGERYYCCYEHFRYDYFNFHFFECQLIQFFQRKDIMKIRNLEVRYKILYNELIKVSGRILNFIFTRIYSKKDYPYFLNMILILINIFTNFGFTINLSDFYLVCMNAIEKKKFKHERCIFYLESLFYFVQLNFLKCTFTLRGGLYNLTDCYIKMIKSDIVPKLTPKTNNRFISLKIEKVSNSIINNSEYFSDFETPLFFDIQRYNKFLGNYNQIDLAEEYIIYHLKSLSLLAKFKIKIHSTIEVLNILVDTILLFDDHYSENFTYKNIVPYCYFSTSFYLVEIGKIAQTVKLLRRMVGENYEVHLKNRLYALTYYNLGLLQYAIGYFDIGIHNIEIAYKMVLSNDFSDKIKFKIIDSLGLAYLNQKNLYKAYILIQTSIKARKTLNQEKYLDKCYKLYVYLNYIVDLYEYNYISKARLLIDKKYKNEDRQKLIKFVLGEEDKELVISEQNLVQFVKVVEFVWKLDEQKLKQLNTDNPPKAPTSIKEEIHHDKSVSGNPDFSHVSSFIYKENLNEANIIDEYEEEIEVKVNLYESFSRQQQQEFKELKSIYLKRDIVLRDSLGNIEKFNINYDPIYADQFQKIIEKLKVNFLLKDIFYCFQNEKWRDELYNYNQNNILFGLSKYLKLEKIQNMMMIEKSKNKENKIKEKLELNSIDNLYEINSFDEYDKEEDDWISVVNKEKDEDNINKKKEEDNSNIYIREYNFNKELSNMPENQRDKNEKKNENMSFQRFKKKFKHALSKHEKDSKIGDLIDFIMDPDESYLYNLYQNVYKNNPDKNFIFQNPSLVLNYIYIDINKPNINPIIGQNSKIIKSVISNVKEEDEEYSNDSKNNKNKEKDFSSDSDIYSDNSRNNEYNITKEKNKKRKNKSLNKSKKLNKSLINKDINKVKDNDNINIEINKNNKIDNKYDLDKEESTLLSFEKELNNYDTQNFIIVSGQATYIYTPKEKIKTKLISKEKDRIKSKDIKNKFKYRSSLPDNIPFNFNLMKDLQNKKNNNSSFIKEHHKTFLEEVDKYFNSNTLVKPEEENNQKSVILNPMKNRNISSLMKSHNSSANTSFILGKDLIKEKIKTRKNNFLLASIQSRKLWKNFDKNNNNNVVNKIINDKNVNEDKCKLKKHKKGLLNNKYSTKINNVRKIENRNTYLNKAMVKEQQNLMRNKELKPKQIKENNLEKEALKKLKTANNSKNITGINLYLNNYNKILKKEEKKESNQMLNSYTYYKKIQQQKIGNDQKKGKEKKLNKNVLNSFEQEKEKILKYNSKLLSLKYNIQNNVMEYEDEYYNINNNNSGINYQKNIFEDSINNKNFIFENSNSYINNMNSISNSNNYKRIINKNNEISSERNSKRSIDANTNRLIQKYKLFPFLKKNNLFRVKENSLLNSLSNTNTQTPRNKKKKIEKNIIKNSIFNKIK